MDAADRAPLLPSSSSSSAAAATSGRQNAAWENPANWRLHLFYYAPDDNRLWVPKKTKIFGIPTGWTVNFAHRWSVPSLSLIAGASAAVGKIAADAAAKRKS